VEKSIGLVFVNSKAQDLEFAKGNVEREFKNAVNRMKNFWRVDELIIIRDPTKEEVEKAFKEAKQSIEEFNNNQSENEVLAVMVRWIGWDIELNRK
jgi:predicted GTPase